MRTLVISDLHLGAARDRDLLRRPRVLEALVRELAATDRLVLLGDVVEFRHGPSAAAVGAATPVLAAIGAALGQGREVVLVPGNHDHHLLDPWLERRGGGRGAEEREPPELSLESPVRWEDPEPLARIAAALSPARLRVVYPGVWLRPDVFATHGHLADRHTTVPMLERLAAGVMALIVSEPNGGPSRIEDYEAVLAPVYAWIHAVAQSGGPELGRSSHGASAGAWQTLSGDAQQRSPRRARARRRALVAAFPLLIATLNRAGIGPLRRQLDAQELRRAPLEAMDEVLRRLGARADHVIFGHTHRAGPLSAQPDPLWRTRSGQRLMNTGCWVREQPAFLGPRPETSPYRGGFAVRVEDDGPPVLTNLLDQDPEARDPA